MNKLRPFLSSLSCGVNRSAIAITRRGENSSTYCVLDSLRTNENSRFGQYYFLSQFNLSVNGCRSNQQQCRSLKKDHSKREAEAERDEAAEKTATTTMMTVKTVKRESRKDDDAGTRLPRS